MRDNAAMIADGFWVWVGEYCVGTDAVSEKPRYIAIHRQGRTHFYAYWNQDMVRAAHEAVERCARDPREKPNNGKVH